MTVTVAPHPVTDHLVLTVTLPDGRAGSCVCSAAVSQAQAVRDICRNLVRA